MKNIPSTWYFSKSTNGWTTDAMAVEWLERVFDPPTTPSLPSEYCLPIMDGHTSHISNTIINTFWSHHIVPLLLLAHLTHIMQLLDVSIFGPLMAAYHQTINDIAHDVIADIDRAKFATIYAQACDKVLTQMSAQKAFSDTGMIINLDPEKALCQLPGYSAASQQTSSLSQSPLQELDVPQSSSTLNTMPNNYHQEPTIWHATQLKQSLLLAYEEPQAKISVLQAENSLLQMQEEQWRKTAQMVKWKDKAVDAMVLSKDKMITCAYAECALVAKKPAMEANWRKYHAKKHQKEEQAVVLPAVLANVGKQALDGSDRALLVSSRTAPMPSTLVIDSLDDGKPLSTVNEENQVKANYFDSVPVAGPSCHHM
ncbi:related to transposase [Sporisorium scitamineum]|uniref:Related to transposase n=1 Tax=Sporisorium scitamineum TaxID=49012 RepID=A0A127ZA88_9BASI|nr:related to transposase [Sporisorium scitamineum]